MLIKRNELTDIEMVMLPKDIMNKELGDQMHNKHVKFY